MNGAGFIEVNGNIIAVEHIVRLHRLPADPDEPERVQLILDVPSEPAILLTGRLAARVWAFIRDDFSTASFDLPAAALEGGAQ